MLGASDWADCERQWRHYQPDLGGRCIEVGCGAGRVTHALAATFLSVAAVDVSEAMLELTTSASPANVETFLVDGVRLPMPDASADAVFTAHVLQHLDGPGYVREYLAEMFRVLRPGGTAMIHTWLRSGRRPVWRRVANSARLAVTRRMLAHGKQVVAWRGIPYRVEELRAWLGEVGFHEIELREFPMSSNGDPHPFWLARRPT